MKVKNFTKKTPEVIRKKRLVLKLKEKVRYFIDNNNNFCLVNRTYLIYVGHYMDKIHAYNYIKYT